MRAGEWMERFLGVVDEHVTSERDILDEYQRARDGIEDPTVRFLLTAILEDERKHHELLGSLRDRVTAAVDGQTWRQSLGRDEVDHLTDLTEQLLGVERQDLEEIREMRDDLDRVRRTGPWRRIRDTLRSSRGHELSDIDKESIKGLDTELENVNDTILWSLVLRIIELDTRKHIEILESLDDVLAAGEISRVATGPMDL